VTAEWLPLTVLLAALGSGAAGGVFLAFSAFVMPALARLPDAEGLAAMQAINRAAPRSAAFLGVLLGTAALSAGVAVVPWLTATGLPAAPLTGGALVYLVGVFGVTVVRNVPLNDALASWGPAEGGAAEAWRRFQARWTAWNHVRTGAGVAAAAAYLLALRGG